MPSAISASPAPSPVSPVLSCDVLGVRVHAATYDGVTRAVLGWARRGEGRTVYATGAHGVIEAQDAADFRAVLNRADRNVPDGMALVRALRALRCPEATRVYGPDLMLHVCRAAAAEGLPIALYGSAPDTLDTLRERLPALAPGLEIACTLSPPFRTLTDEEDAALTDVLRDSGARVVFVGLGCPKQERWCDAHRERLPAVLVAVGAAFDFHAGRLAQAPAWIQRAGLEWAFRLAVEPRRLWRRYARVVPRFLWGFWLQRFRTSARVPRPVEAL